MNYHALTSTSPVPSSPDETVAIVRHLSLQGVKSTNDNGFTKRVANFINLAAEDGLQPDFIVDGDIKTLGDHLLDLEERLTHLFQGCDYSLGESPQQMAASRRAAHNALQAVQTARMEVRLKERLKRALERQEAAGN